MDDEPTANLYCEAFEFDAPKFQDFDLTPYKNRARFIEALLSADQNTVNLHEGWNVSSVSSPTKSEPDIDWFQNYHYTHEPSEPPSPPIPLITPVITKRVGLGSPGRVVRSTSSEKSRPASTPLRLKQTKTTTFSPLRLQSPLRADTTALSSSAIKSGIMENDSLSRIQQIDVSMRSGGGLSQSPSPPRLHHDLTNLEDVEMLDFFEYDGNYSRRNSENLSDFDLTQDELIGMTRKVTRHANVTMRPQRIIKDVTVSSSPTLRTVTKGRLCPPPPAGVRKPAHQERTVPTKPGFRHTNVQAVDIKKLLQEHNQRVRRR